MMNSTRRAMTRLCQKSQMPLTVNRASQRLSVANLNVEQRRQQQYGQRRLFNSSSQLLTRVKNDNLKDLADDYLYHLGLSATDKDKFGDVKFFCAGGSGSRMGAFAQQVAGELGILPYGMTATTIGKTDRFSIYKVGPVLICSHGMGQASFSILLHEVTKLLHYAGAEDVAYFRLGSSGGIGVPPGTVVLTTEAVDGEIKPRYSLPILGQVKTFPTKTNESLVNDLFESTTDDFVVRGKTMAAECFYEGQGRLDGALCDYNESDKMEFLHKLDVAGVKNIEMESGMFAAFTSRLNIRGAVVCATLLNRLHGDQVLTPPEQLHDFDSRPGRVIIDYIKKQLKL
eukprot:m.259450 g.259450  ORF g.259450 m.259450 type:complete len:342 (-) comp38076_c0_seq1:71-1096(-)